METKICSTCNLPKLLTEYGKQKDAKNGIKPHCKECEIKRKQEWAEGGEDRRKEFIKTHDTIKCNDCKKELTISEFNENKHRANGFEGKCNECRILYKKEMRIKHPETTKKYSRKYWKENKEKIRKRENTLKNKNKRKKRLKKWYKKRRENNPLRKLIDSMRSNVHGALKQGGYKKTSRTFEIIGCSYEDLKIHIEKQFEHWMDWDNYGKIKIGKFNIGWDVDHIIPTSSANTEEELLKLFHYTNLQPLCSYTNRYIKRDRLDFYD